MRLYKINDKAYINLDAVEYVSIAYNGFVILYTSSSSFVVSPGEWEKIKNQHLVSL